MLGPPIFERKSLDFRQSTDGPMIRIGRDNATIYVGPYAVLCESTLVSNLAHETVHLHVGDGIPGLTSGLEEGFAVYFELTKVAQQFGELERQIHVAHLPASYQNALRDYNYLMTRVENPASLAFNSFGKLTGLSWLEIRQIFPGIGWRMIYRLTRRRRMRPV